MNHTSVVFSFFVSIMFAAAAGCAPTPEQVTPTLPPIVQVTAESSPTVQPTATLAPTVTPLPTATATPAPTATPFITPPAAGQAIVAPILMYHHLKYLEPNASEALQTWTVAPDQFAAQLDYLQQKGFHTITFKQLVEFFDNGAPLPTNPILLTFDDGWIDGYTVAFPELTKRGMVGNFFVPTQYADAGGELFMNWDQIREMDRAGMEIDGHTIDHADLNKANLDVLRRQLRASKQQMEQELGHPVYALSYPFGAFNAGVVAETEAAGYRAAVILCCGYELNSDILLTLPRIRISYNDPLSEIEKKLP